MPTVKVFLMGDSLPAARYAASILTPKNLNPSPTEANDGMPFFSEP